MKNKYDLNKDLKKYRKLVFPCNKLLITLSRPFLGFFYQKEKLIRKFKVKEKYIKYKDKNNKEIKVKYLFYQTKENENKVTPLIIFFHGGGFCFNGAWYHYSLLKEFLKKTGYKGIFLNYRLTPKYKYPSQNEDCLNLYKTVIKEKDNLKIDINNIHLIGDSAGATLVGSTTFLAHKNNLILPKTQTMLYPFASRDFNLPSMVKYFDAPMCNTVLDKKFLEIFVPKDTIDHSLYSLIELEDVSFFPKTRIEVAEYDSLRDGGELLFKRIKEESSSYTEFFELKKAMHGYDIAYKSELIQKVIEDRIKFIKED